MTARTDQNEKRRIDNIERRLQILEDAEAIRNLKAHYAALCDDNYNADGIAELFCEDAIWESPTLEVYSTEGNKKAYKEFEEGKNKQRKGV